MNHRLRQIVFLLLSVFFLLFSACTFAEELSFPNPEQPISLDFKDVSLKDILKIFSIQSGLNFIASEVVRDRTFTLYLENVPVKDAMDKIFKANNLTYELDPESKIFIVKEWGKPTIETITRVFPLKYSRIPGSNLVKQISAALGATADKGIVEAVKLVMSEYGKITEDARTNSLIITDIPARFDLIEETIARLDVPIPQVLIEVEMLDVSKSSVDLLGVKFGTTWLHLSGSETATTFPLGRRLAKTGADAPTKGFTTGILSTADLSVALQFLSTQSDTKYLARPRLLTLSNETAEIKITTNEAVGITRAKERETGYTTETAERVETGVSLKVTPQTNIETGDITLFIEPKVKEAKPGATFAGMTYKDPEERGTKSVVMIKDGQTIVIGGLLRREISTSLIKVPFLGDIPILGALFRHRSIEPNKERELLVFLTPHIVKEEILVKVKEKPEVLEREQEPLILRREAIKESLKNFE